MHWTFRKLKILDGMNSQVFYFIYIFFFFYQLNQEAEVSSFLKDEANINAVWASAIIEECTRLGLTVS